MTTNNNLDGWANLISGLGIEGKDKRKSSYISWEPLSLAEVEELYAEDDTAAKIVDYLPEEMTREWITHEIETDILTIILNREKELNIKKIFTKALKWARLYGGSGILMVTDDFQNISELALPLDLTKINKLYNLIVFNRWELQTHTLESDIKNKNFGMPKLYQLSSTVANSSEMLNTVIHASRIIRFDGVELGRLTNSINNYWGDSVLSRANNAISNYQTSNDSAISALQDFSVGCFKMKGLADKVAAGREDQIRTRIELANLSKSVIRAMIMDESESFENITRALTGVPEVLKASANRLVAASDIPHTKLLGESPSGLGATGRSEESVWYDYVSAKQNDILKPALEQLFSIIQAELKISEPISFYFNSLWQMDRKEEAEIRKVTAETDAIYMDRGVVSPEEMGSARFANGVWNDELKIEISPSKTYSELPKE